MWSRTASEAPASNGGSQTVCEQALADQAAWDAAPGRPAKPLVSRTHQGCDGGVQTPRPPPPGRSKAPSPIALTGPSRLSPVEHQPGTARGPPDQSRGSSTVPPARRGSGRTWRGCRPASRIPRRWPRRRAWTSSKTPPCPRAWPSTTATTGTSRGRDRRGGVPERGEQFRPRAVRAPLSRSGPWSSSKSPRPAQKRAAGPNGWTITEDRRGEVRRHPGGQLAGQVQRESRWPRGPDDSASAGPDVTVNLDQGRPATVSGCTGTMDSNTHARLGPAAHLQRGRPKRGLRAVEAFNTSTPTSVHVQANRRIDRHRGRGIAHPCSGRS